MKYRIAILGSYGGMNLGDEAILQVILRQIRECLDAEVLVLSRNAEDTQRRHKVRAINVRDSEKDQIINELKSMDLFILGGGGILFDGMAQEMLRHVKFAKELGIPIMVYAISVGPLQDPEAKKLVSEVLNRVDLISVRENEARRLLIELGVTQHIELTADPALLMQEEPLTDDIIAKKGFDPALPIVGFSVREPGKAAPDLDVDHYHAVLANAADFMIERFKAEILFIPMEPGERRDMQHSHAIISKMSNTKKADVLKGEYSSGQILSLVKHFSFAVGMRLHFLIFCALQNVPFVPLPYAAKVSGFISDLGLGIESISDLNVGKLCAYLDRAWDSRPAIKKKLAENVPPLQQKARRTNQILCEFLRAVKPESHRVT